MLGTDPGVSEYQVRQSADGAEIAVVGSANADALSKSVIAALQRHGLTAPLIDIRFVDRIARHEATGKLRRFIPLQNPHR